jgi:outer membrane protein
MNNLKIKKSLIPCLTMAAIILAGASFSSASFANDITHSVRSDTEQIGSTENYLELGIAYNQGSGPSFIGGGNANSAINGYYSRYGMIINGSYSWNNIFFENYSESGHGVVFGYNAFNNDNWSFDLTATTEWLKQSSFENNGRFGYVNNRDYSKEFTVGGRLIGYFGDNVVQFTANQDATGDHNGTTVSAQIGRNWQVRNWNLHGILGVEYTSAKLNDFYVGVSEARAAHLSNFFEGFSAYDAGASVSFSTELGVTYPISEDWVFRATARAATISDELIDSPYFKDKDSLGTSFRTSLSYVF